MDLTEHPLLQVELTRSTSPRPELQHVTAGVAAGIFVFNVKLSLFYCIYYTYQASESDLRHEVVVSEGFSPGQGWRGSNLYSCHCKLIALTN